VARGYIPERRHSQSSYTPILSSEGRSGLSLGWNCGPGMSTPRWGRESSSRAFSPSCPRRLQPGARACA
jgi:hypothetical protein